MCADPEHFPAVLSGCIAPFYDGGSRKPSSLAVVDYRPRGAGLFIRGLRHPLAAVPGASAAAHSLPPPRRRRGLHGGTPRRLTLPWPAPWPPGRDHNRTPTDKPTMPIRAHHAMVRLILPLTDAVIQVSSPWFADHRKEERRCHCQPGLAHLRPSPSMHRHEGRPDQGLQPVNPGRH
jgi:hypothetical protein